MLGAHYLSDVLAGIGMALIGLPLSMMFANMVLRKASQEKLPALSIVWGFLLGFLTLLFMALEIAPPETCLTPHTAGIDPEGDGPLVLLDVASGCGIKSMALAQSRPGVHVACIDRAVVLEVAMDLASW